MDRFLNSSDLQTKFKSIRDAYIDYEATYKKYTTEQDYIIFKTYFVQNEMQKFKTFFESEKWQSFITDYFESKGACIFQLPRATVRDCGCLKMYYAYLLNQRWIPVFDREKAEEPLKFNRFVAREEFVEYAKAHTKDFTYTLQDLEYLERLYKELYNQD